MRLPKAPIAPESQIQADIVKALTVAGFRVKVTSAPLQRGKSGVTKGIPDLLVSHPGLPFFYIGMEVKTPKGTVRPEQLAASQANEYRIVRSVEDALAHALAAMAVAPGVRVDRARQMLRELKVEPL